ncbi:hypothetical protein ARAM_002025 [Aspergillus rambellii]|uniref:RanBD1 domain-containing protein n=1 Tax=Aspergillus rambellii TaxID=308745 RepID=A0A0F8X880_9EURO|nr:hypothetical protein ARAM_002025 [Aspergillus rambellii]
MSSTPDEKPQRATAAQMAQRRIKEIRRRPRPGASAASGAPAASFGGPFSSIDPNTVSSTSTAPQPVTNGFTFGQSQSFPGAGSTPKPATENGGSGFSFGSGTGGSSSFNFSSSFGGAGASANPFASINTGATSQQSDAGSFSGFKGNLFNIPANSQSPAQQPLPTGGIFGTGSQSTSTGGLFGTTTTTAPAPKSGATTPPNGSIFGQSTTTAPSTNIFGQSAVEKPTPFAQSSAFSSDSMQTSPDAKTTAPKSTMFGSGTGGFGVTAHFGGSGTSNLFGATTSTPADSASKPLFGAKPEQPSPASTSLFGATTQPTSSTTVAPASSAAAPVASSTSLFSTSSSKPTAPSQNPFQSANLFGAPTPSSTLKSAEEKGKEEAKAVVEPAQTPPVFKFPSTTASTSLFSKSETAPPTQSAGGLFQPPSSGSLFAPQTTTSMGQEKPKPAGSNPFSTLFSPKPTSPEKSQTEQKPLPSATPFANLFAPKSSTPDEGTKTNEPSTAPALSSSFSASASAKPSSSLTSQPAAFSFSGSQANGSASAPTSAGTSQSLFKANGTKPTLATPPTPSALDAPSQSFDKLQPVKMPSDLDKGTKDEVEMLYRVRLLNECFRREVEKLDPTTEGFDALVRFYVRVRETIGAPIEGAGSKRKTPDSEEAAANKQPAKKIKPFGPGEGLVSGAGSTPTAAASSAQLFGTSQRTPSSHKRKATEDGEADTAPTPQPTKRVNGDSTTASIFASSFSRSKTSDAENDSVSTESPQIPSTPSFKPTSPETNGPSLFSTTPTSSPTKPLFSAPVPAKEATSTSSSSTSQPISGFKPTFTAPTSSNPPANPFVLKTSGDAAAGTSTPSLSMPKFGSGSVTNFFAQFKAQSDKNAEKEKEKRKAEDFDSDEEDEAEWERKDAENQRKKREELEAQKSKRTKFVPGQGFSFEEENDTADEAKADNSPASSPASTSVFNAPPNTSGKSTNIFGHLSATPSETEENDHDDAEDTEEASVSGDDVAKDPSFVPASEEEDSRASSIGICESSVQESSDEGDLSKALKKSKQATKEQASAEGSGSRSLFDRVQYDQDGKPKRGGEGDKGLSTFFNSSKFASSFNSPVSTPNPFAPTGQQVADKADESSAAKPASTNNIFGSASATGSLFGSPAPTPSGASTPSVFGASSSATKPGADNTWKINSPIKFAPDSATPKATPKSESTLAAPAADPAKPFSTLFGAPPAGSKSSSGGGAPTLGFSFGGPSSQPSSSFLAPPTFNSTATSRASTPGIPSDAGAEESGDGDAPESLPQVDLSRSGAGEENEDVVMETRARGMKLSAEAGWESQGVGFLRVLKDRTTSRGRILLRADPSGKVVLNVALMKEITYSVSGTSVQFLVPQADGPPEKWAVRVKKEEAERLGKAMEETKS